MRKVKLIDRVERLENILSNLLIGKVNKDVVTYGEIRAVLIQEGFKEVGL